MPFRVHLVELAEFHPTARVINHRAKSVPGYRRQKVLLVREDQDPDHDGSGKATPWPVIATGERVPYTIRFITIWVKVVRKAVAPSNDPEKIDGPQDIARIKTVIGHEIGHDINLAWNRVGDDWPHCGFEDCIMYRTPWQSNVGYSDPPHHDHVPEHDLTYSLAVPW